MNNDAIAIVLSSGLSLLGLAYLYLWVYRDYRRDLLRTRLFEIRAELFDGATDGRIHFNHPAYGLMRGTLNGYLRSGHEMGALRLLLTAVLLDQRELEKLYGFKGQWRKAASTLTPEVRVWLESLRDRAHDAFFRHLLATTGFAYLGIVLWLAFRERRPRRQSEPPNGMTVPRPPESFNYRLDSAALATADPSLPSRTPAAA